MNSSEHDSESVARPTGQAARQTEHRTADRSSGAGPTGRPGQPEYDATHRSLTAPGPPASSSNAATKTSEPNQNLSRSVALPYFI